ncbi:XdhC family protein [Halioglobus maricola]|nr:XdhC family protein [Halioglobus maricola]
MELDILERSRHWCGEDLSPWLCTIVRAVGSSPRPVGSMLCCLASGEQVGSLSGGCVEEDLLERIQQGKIDRKKPQIVEYGVSPEDNEKLGLPCGGRLFVLVQQLDQTDISWIEKAVAAIQQRHCIERRLNLETGATETAHVEHFTHLMQDTDSLRQCFGPKMRMLLVGAGQLAQSLAELALAMDYEVLVTDTRQATLNQWMGPEVPLLQGMPDDIVRAHAADSFSIVITLTHDPRIDDMALMEALNTDAWYVGALGSERTTEKRLRRLRALELDESAIAKLHAPVGLAIGSKTPLEIAVAIMAELTQLRRGSVSEAP